jgi:hypothetical protein
MHAPPPDTIYRPAGPAAATPGQPVAPGYMYPPPRAAGQPVPYATSMVPAQPMQVVSAPPGMVLVQTAPGQPPTWQDTGQFAMPVGQPGPAMASQPPAAAPGAAPAQPMSAVQSAVAMAQAAASQRKQAACASGAAAPTQPQLQPQAAPPQVQHMVVPAAQAPAGAEPQSSTLTADFEVPDDYPLAEHIRGPNNSYLQHIESETSVTVQLRGRDAGGKHEPADPLSIWIFHPEPWKRTAACDLAKSLLETARHGAEAWGAAKLYGASDGAAAADAAAAQQAYAAPAEAQPAHGEYVQDASTSGAYHQAGSGHEQLQQHPQQQQQHQAAGSAQSTSQFQPQQSQYTPQQQQQQQQQPQQYQQQPQHGYASTQPAPPGNSAGAHAPAGQLMQPPAGQQSHAYGSASPQQYAQHQHAFHHGQPPAYGAQPPQRAPQPALGSQHAQQQYAGYYGQPAGYGQGGAPPGYGAPQAAARAPGAGLGGAPGGAGGGGGGGGKGAAAPAAPAQPPPKRKFKEVKDAPAAGSNKVPWLSLELRACRQTGAPVMYWSGAALSLQGVCAARWLKLHMLTHFDHA